MLNPSALYRFETDADLTVPRPGVLVVTLGAFVDAGQIQSVLGGHLLETGDPEVVASFDVDQLLDYRGRRPAMVPIFGVSRGGLQAVPSPHILL